MLWVSCISIVFFAVSGYAVGEDPMFRILGGNKVDIENYPYVVSLQIIDRGQRKHICGATLISPTAILTAAHCLRAESQYVIRAGSSSLKNSEGCVVPISRITFHPQYRYLSQDYDIAVGTLMKPVKLTSKIQPVKLPPFSKDIPLTNGTVLGWGATATEGTISDNLRAIDIPIIDDDECVRSYPKGLVTDRMFCARDSTGSKDSCQGDSGGPLIVNGTIYGIVSWGFYCGNPENPGVYTRVPYFADFINKSLATKKKLTRFYMINRFIGMRS